MKNNMHENTDYKPPIGIMISIGTTAVKVGLALRKQELIYGLDNQEKQLPLVGIDASGIRTTFPVPMIDPSLQDLTLGPNESLACPLHDAESLQQAEEEGKLWFMQPNWHDQPGVAKDNCGSGGNPRTGKALGQLNIHKMTKKIRTMLRLCRDYCKQRDIMNASNDEKITSAPVTIVVCTSFLGGFGSGNTITVLRILRKLERELKLPVRIVLLGLVLGTLEPTDKLTAARNQEMLMRQLDSCMVGQMDDIQSQSPQRHLLCDSMVLMSNSNNHGEITSFDKNVSQAATYVFNLFHSTLGGQVLERIVDIEEFWPDDENGGKLWASTAAITKIHLDVPLIIQCVDLKLLKIFFDRILRDKPIKQASKQAETLCAEQMLSEDGTKNLASQRLIRSDGSGSSHAVNDTIRVFQDRSGSRGGFQGCCDIANASKYTLGVYLQRNIDPMISRQADTMTENVIRSLSNATTIGLRRPDGLPFTRQFLESIASKIKTFAEANAKKLRNAQAKKKSIDDRLSAGHTLLKKLQNRHPIFRFFCFGTKKKCRQIFTLQTEQAIKTVVEIKARIELANDIYPVILKSISETLKT
ncbi:MAG: tubulin-like doman-containing protein, partial [Planctomycetota bacterium]